MVEIVARSGPKPPPERPHLIRVGHIEASIRPMRPNRRRADAAAPRQAQAGTGERGALHLEQPGEPATIAAKAATVTGAPNRGLETRTAGARPERLLSAVIV